MKTASWTAAIAITFLLAPCCALSAPVHAWRGTIEIPTYELGPADPNPVFPLLNRNPVYPYTMLDSLGRQRAPKTYKAIFLENEYLKITILPQLGGHVYSIYDKVDRREVLYCNHVVKYGLIGPRGAWISGGIEFSFPFAHTDVTVSPVESALRYNADGSATAVVGAIDWVSGMHWEVGITLRPDTARVEQRVTLFNPTPAEHLYLFWANAAVKVTDDMQYIYPMRETISDDPYAVVQSWPVWKGVDESWYKNNPRAMAIFARASHRNFFGVYYHKQDYGVVHVANFRQDPGKKLWTWGTAESGLIWATLLSDNDGPYGEIQSGRFFTQGYREFMPPDRVERWKEYWYPVRGLDGGVVDATKQMAINAEFAGLKGGQSIVNVIVSPVADVDDATVILKLGSKPLREFHHVHFAPLSPVTFSAPVGSLAEARKDLAVEIQSAQHQPILRWSAAEPIDGNSDFTPAAGTSLRKPVISSKTPVQALFLHGLFLEKQGNLQEALKVYDQALQRDLGYVPALLRLAWHSYAAADFMESESLIRRALKREPESPAAHYAEGVVERAAGRLSLAKNAFWDSIHYGGPVAPSLLELGEIAIREGNYAQGAGLLRRAAANNAGDALALADYAAAQRLAGNSRAAMQTSADALQKMPLLPFALAEQWLDGSNAGTGNPTAAPWTRILSGDPENYLAVAAWYHRLGAWRSSDLVLALAERSQPAQDLSPMIYYYLASNARREGNSSKAHEDALKAASMRCEQVFPNSVTDAAVLKEAVDQNPADSHAKYALGNFLFAHGRYSDASGLWLKALNEGFNNPVLLRNLGVYEWRVTKGLPAAAQYYSSAIKLTHDDFRLYADLDKIYTEGGNTLARARLFESAPADVLQQDPVRARYALLLLEQSKYGQALGELINHQFEPWEGGVEIHQIFARANIEKGKQALANRDPAGAEHDFRAAMEYPANLGVGKPYQPDDQEPLYWLGEALHAQHRNSEAESAWKLAAKGASSGQGEIYAALALAKLGHHEEAKQMLERSAHAFARPAARSYDYFISGLAERYRHRAPLARENFLHALGLDPLFWQARVALNEIDRRAK
ncbi:MAG: DUF5107 domain-containing protein [Acidobacteriota bacterium]|nr:DUF5107 domain-containing protein [Acidobacteriota bacterium]